MPVPTPYLFVAYLLLNFLISSLKYLNPASSGTDHEVDYELVGWEKQVLAHFGMQSKVSVTYPQDGK